MDLVEYEGVKPGGLKKIMKKLSIILALSILLTLLNTSVSHSLSFFFSPRETITIASFNIRVFSNNSRDNEELNYIADVLQSYDIIAIQELRDEEVLKRTVAILKERDKEYEYEISEKVGRGVKERYAFLYRKDKVEVIKEGKFYQEENDEFIREPYYATFKAGNFDFTLITVHILYGSSKAERRPEIIELATVYQKIQDEDPTEQDIILLGDFNFPPTDTGFDNLKSISTMTFLIAPPAKTTITDTSLYDNFWFQKNMLRNIQEIQELTSLMKLCLAMMTEQQSLQSQTIDLFGPYLQLTMKMMIN